jgi:putative addiction module component (TIGR02574 family)
MNERVKKLAEEAKKLTYDEQVDLLDELFIALRDHDAEIDKAWAEEALRRAEAHDRGEMTAVPAKDVFARLGRTLK